MFDCPQGDTTFSSKAVMQIKIVIVCCLLTFFFHLKNTSLNSLPIDERRGRCQVGWIDRLRVGNHDNAVSGHHHTERLLPVEKGRYQIKRKILISNGTGEAGRKNGLQPYWNAKSANDRSHTRNTWKQGSGDNYKRPWAPYTIYRAKLLASFVSRLTFPKLR